MAIYVDQIKEYPAVKLAMTHWCHMGTDDHSLEGLEALHALAQSIGLKREWFQDRQRFPHYDLVPSKRTAALNCGAVACTDREWIAWCKQKDAVNAAE